MRLTRSTSPSHRSLVGATGVFSSSRSLELPALGAFGAGPLGPRSLVGATGVFSSSRSLKAGNS